MSLLPPPLLLPSGVLVEFEGAAAGLLLLGFDMVDNCVVVEGRRLSNVEEN